MEDLVIREIRDSDIDKCVDVIRKSFLTVAEDFGLTEDNCATNGAFLKRERLVYEKENGTLMFAACLSNEIIGFIAIRPKENNIIDIEKLGVLPQYRHFGYGKCLLNFAKDKAILLNADKMTIGIIEENLRLKKWYQSYGFKSTGTKFFPHLPFTVGFMEMNL